ncbi:YbaN family protein [Chakrabartyella piscis]|uniref:YbaN family protein n=1 Tax=Chakrabartyella piscis TaxID=2918914 RepID=UPI00295865B7|nr:YbaN family protein [Chakrabartyella piscis]
MKYVWIGIGFFFLALGGIGVALPMIPATPFLFLTAVCFGKGSKRIDDWFKGTKMYKDNLESLVNKEGMTIAAKKRVMGCISGLFVVSAICMRNVKIGLMVMLAVWVLHALIFAFVIQTKEDEVSQ